MRNRGVYRTRSFNYAGKRRQNVPSRARIARISRRACVSAERDPRSGRMVLWIIMKRESITSSLFRSLTRICGAFLFFLALRTTIAIYEPEERAYGLYTSAVLFRIPKHRPEEVPETERERERDPFIESRDAQGRRQFRRRVDKLPLPSPPLYDSNYVTARDEPRSRDRSFIRLHDSPSQSPVTFSRIKSRKCLLSRPFYQPSW